MTKSLWRAETGTPDNRANQQYLLPLSSINHDARKDHNIRFAVLRHMKWKVNVFKFHRYNMIKGACTCLYS